MRDTGSLLAISAFPSAAPAKAARPTYRKAPAMIRPDDKAELTYRFEGTDAPAHTSRQVRVAIHRAPQPL